MGGVGGREKNFLPLSAPGQLLGYQSKERDREGSRFWFLRPGASQSAAKETQPIAVGFYYELNSLSDYEIKAFLTSQEQQQEIYGHYMDIYINCLPVFKKNYCPIFR